MGLAADEVSFGSSRCGDESIDFVVVVAVAVSSMGSDSSSSSPSLFMSGGSPGGQPGGSFIG